MFPAFGSAAYVLVSGTACHGHDAEDPCCTIPPFSSKWLCHCSSILLVFLLLLRSIMRALVLLAWGMRPGTDTGSGRSKDGLRSAEMDMPASARKWPSPLAGTSYPP